MTVAVDAEEVRYGLDEARVIFPRAWCGRTSQARYRGWRELEAVGMVDEPFDPRRTVARRCWAFRTTADPCAEVTHRTTGDPLAPGAWPAWVVEVAGTQ